MERLVYIVEQIHEAGRFLSLNSTSHARMALLLLDNAAEILMHRAIWNELQLDDQWARIFKHAQASLSSDKAAAVIHESGYRPIPPKQRKAMEWLFVPKVDFLVEQGRLPAVMGQVVKALHRYRNDAYHRDRVRRDTLHAAAIIYYEIACELLGMLPPSLIVFSSTDDWSRFRRKFELQSHSLMGSKDIEKIVSKLRSEIGIESNTLAEVLSDHLVSRIDELNEQLNFICENVGREATPAGELKHIQFWKDTGRLPTNDANPDFVAYTPKYALAHLDAWRVKAVQLHGRVGEGKLHLLRDFSDVEQQLEPLEDMVNEVALLIDAAIQLEIDRARGK